MSLNNIPKPTTTYNNTFKVLGYETWDSNTSSWGTETRTWDQMASVFDNSAKPSVAGGTIEVGIKFMGHIMQYNDSIAIAGNTLNNLPKP